MVRGQPGLDGLGLVVLALLERLAALVAHALLLRGGRHHMVGGPAVDAGPAAGHSPLNLLVGDLNGDHRIELDTGLLQGLSLGDGAGHPVQDIALLAVGLGQPLGDDADDDVVRDQLAGVHILLGLQAHGGAVGHGGAEDVAGGNGGDVQLLADDLRLSAFTGARGAQQDQLHSTLLTPKSPCSGASSSGPPGPSGSPARRKPRS